MVLLLANIRCKIFDPQYVIYEEEILRMGQVFWKWEEKKEQIVQIFT